MSKDNPTPDEQTVILQTLYAAYNPTADEISAILQHLYGSYGVELPDWYVNHVSSGRSDNGAYVIPGEAVTVAAIAIRKDDNDMSGNQDEETHPALTDSGSTELACAALKAASPIMFAKMQEQQAQLDAVKAQIEIWEKQPMGGNDLASLTARYAFETVCKKLRTALETTR